MDSQRPPTKAIRDLIQSSFQHKRRWVFALLGILAILVVFSLLFVDRQKKAFRDIHVLSTDGDLLAVENLIRQGIDVNLPGPFRYTPLHFAVKGNRLSIARFLIEKGVDVNARPFLGEMPLYEAVRQANTHIVRLLLENGADPNRSARLLKSPMGLAKKKNYVEIQRMIQKYQTSTQTIGNREIHSD